MAYFARKLWYGAHDGDDSHVFAAFLELRRRKNGKPIAFLLFEHRVFTSQYQGRKPGTCEDRMIRFPQCTSAEQALERFTPGQKEFPGWNCEQWEKTTGWAYGAGAGGSYELYHPGTWVRIPMPNPWRNRHRRKKQLQVGNISHLLHVHQTQLQGLTDMKSDLKMERSGIEVYEYPFDEPEVSEGYEIEHQILSEKIAKVDEEIVSVQSTIDVVKEEMRFKVRRMFPKPAGKTPNKVIRAILSKAAPWPHSC